jgi:hypothetical protein
MNKTKKEPPCEAVMLLVQRMESHPEEFALNSTSKWHNLLSIVKKRVVDGDKDAFIILDEFEVEMVWNKYRAAGKRSLHAFIMGKILEGNGEGNE